MSGVLRKRGKLDTDTHTEETSCDNEGRVRDDVPASQGTSKIARKLPEARSEA